MSSRTERDAALAHPHAERRSSDQDERIRLGLIQYLTEHPIDPDYAWVGKHAPGLGGPRARWLGAVVLVVFGLLVFVAASQTTRNAGTDARERAELVDQIDARRTTLDKRLDQAATLRRDNERLQESLLTSGNTSLAERVRRLGVLTGNRPVTGPGITLVANDAKGADSDRERVLDKDLQRLVNGLWAAGAEAVSVNGQRITNLTAIREASSAINVNYIPLRAPYTVRAIGDPDTLASRFADSTSGAAWFDLTQQVGLRLSITNTDEMTVPAVDRLVLRYAMPPGKVRSAEADNKGATS